MRYTNPWLTPAFDLIEKYDPATYRRMNRTEWFVKVVSEIDDLDSIMENDGLFIWMQIAGTLSHAFGVTDMAERGDSSHTPPDLIHVTWLNKPDIEHAASEVLSVPVAEFLADVLVHEFKHRDERSGEKEAFAAGTQFAYTMGNAAIAEFSEETAATVDD